MDAERALRLTNRNMMAFDLVLGSARYPGPRRDPPRGSDTTSLPRDAEHLFRRCGPIWLTFAAAHAVAARRGKPEDWWALAWLRGTELATDVAVVPLPRLLAPRGAPAGPVARRSREPGDDARLRLARYPPLDEPLGRLHSVNPTSWARFRRSTWPDATWRWAAA